MWEDVKAWLKAKGGIAHIVAVAFTSAIVAYAAVPPFHTLVLDVWAKTPPMAREAGLAFAGLYAWYKQNQKGV